MGSPSGKHDRHDAPLRRDVASLAGVLIQTVEPSRTHRVVIDRTMGRALDLLESITLALVGIDREDRLLDADAALQAVRCLVRMLRDLEVLDDDQYLGFAEQADKVGRQIGGWLGQLRRAG